MHSSLVCCNFLFITISSLQKLKPFLFLATFSAYHKHGLHKFQITVLLLSCSTALFCLFLNPLSCLSHFPAFIASLFPSSSFCLILLSLTKITLHLYIRVHSSFSFLKSPILNLYSKPPFHSHTCFAYMM